MASTSKADLEHPPGPEIPEHTERIEDMVEEVEDAVDGDAEDISEETLESFIELDTESSRPATEGVATATKEKFFSCEKCNYVTHIRSRYTKHVKYHSMPMIKCTMCDFRTPYKWNLDRHMKNHGGTGSFHCSMCNFTADIKQSLTVHEMNHHTPPVGHTAASRRRNRVGASDVTMADEAAQALITKEEEGSGDSSHEAAVSVLPLPLIPPSARGSGDVVGEGPHPAGRGAGAGRGSGVTSRDNTDGPLFISAAPDGVGPSSPCIFLFIA